jgi:hypothetical protein
MGELSPQVGAWAILPRSCSALIKLASALQARHESSNPFYSDDRVARTAILISEGFLPGHGSLRC